MKKIIIATILLTLILAACTTTPAQEIDAAITTQTTQVIALTTTTAETTTSAEVSLNTAVAERASLHMTVEQLLEMFEDEDIIIEWPESYENFFSYDGPMIMDGRFYNFDGSFHFRTDSIEASFLADSTLTRFSVISNRFVTMQGIRVGDTRERMLEIYGQDFIPDTFGYDVVIFYHYDQGDYYLSFRVQDGVVESWGLTTRIAGYQ